MVTVPFTPGHPCWLPATLSYVTIYPTHPGDLKNRHLAVAQSLISGWNKFLENPCLPSVQTSLLQNMITFYEKLKPDCCASLGMFRFQEKKGGEVHFFTDQNLSLMQTTTAGSLF